MTKIVYNACYGGFGLSDAAIMRYAEIKGITLYSFAKLVHFRDGELDRDDPVLVQVVEELGDGANGRHADLQIEELPAGTLYCINEYDGLESVMTQDDYDWRVA